MIETGTKGGKKQSRYDFRNLMEEMSLPSEELDRILPEMPPFPERLSFIWDAFDQLSHFRKPGFSGPEPIGADTIFYWQQLHGVRLQPRDIAVLKDLDNTYLHSIHDTDGDSEEANNGD